MATISSPAEERTILHNVSWKTYECLLADFERSRSPRLTYDQGTLEIMSPLPRHEQYNQTLTSLVEVISEEWRIDIWNLGSTTFKREDLARGFEADCCFYFENAARVRGKDRIDLKTDPPPDLVIEIDHTHSSLDKLPIYAQLGVPEVWRYDGRAVTILRLENGAYCETDESVLLAGADGASLAGFITERELLTHIDWLQKVRGWAREKLSRRGTEP
jgi:Uma2 family endonuclease